MSVGYERDGNEAGAELGVSEIFNGTLHDVVRLQAMQSYERTKL
jgi:hypothetical protein